MTRKAKPTDSRPNACIALRDSIETPCESATAGVHPRKDGFATFLFVGFRWYLQMQVNSYDIALVTAVFGGPRCREVDRVSLR
jgi:hypothetical protein